MKTPRLIILLLLVGLYSFGQNRNSIWCFGDSAGIDFNNSIPVPFSSGLDTRGSCTSVADSEGNLLFYANTRATITGNTSLVRNKNNSIMPNGINVVGQGWYNELLIISKPGDSITYCLLTIGVTNSGNLGLYYSVIDLSQDSYLGDVVQKNVLLDSSEYYYDAMAAVKHGNGRDWWLISKRYDLSGNGDSTFQVFLIGTDTILHFSQSIGGYNYGNLANMTFSKAGDKFLFTSTGGIIEVFDFDRCTGLLSTPKIIHPFGQPYSQFWGSAFSPSGNLIYVCTNDSVSRLLQFDLSVGNSWALRDTIAKITYPTYAGGALRLAPDSKIYWSNAYYNGVDFNYPYADTMRNVYNENLSVINNPDLLGSACNFTAYSFYLGGKRTYWGLPNNPDYDMPALTGSPCDTLTSSIPNINFQSQPPALKLSPNPATSQSEVTFTYPSVGTPSQIVLNNIDGKEVVRYALPLWSSMQHLQLPKLATGIYVARLLNPNFARTPSVKFVVQ